MNFHDQAETAPEARFWAGWKKSIFLRVFSCYDFIACCVATDFRYWKSRSDVVGKKKTEIYRIFMADRKRDFGPAGKSRFFTSFFML